MPQISQFLGVNSVTNIELTKGFMPAFICIFVDWLENSCTSDSARDLPATPGHHRVEAAHPIAKWPFALMFKSSGNLPIY
jgi:hypothetical protein